MPRAIQKKYSFANANVFSLTVPPNMAINSSEKIRYNMHSTMPPAAESTTALPTPLCASSRLSAPSDMLTNAQQPSPIITAIARAMTVSGNTTVFAALPSEPRYAAFAMNIWSTML